MSSKITVSFISYKLFRILFFPSDQSGNGNYVVMGERADQGNNQKVQPKNGAFTFAKNGALFLVSVRNYSNNRVTGFRRAGGRSLPVV